MELNEKMYSTEELKAQAKKMPEKKPVSTKVILGYKNLTPDEKSILNYNLKDYNKTCGAYSKLRSAMIAGRIADSENPSAIKNLRVLKNKAEGIHRKHIAPVMRTGASKRTEEKAKPAFKDRVNKYKGEM